MCENEFIFKEIRGCVSNILMSEGLHQLCVCILHRIQFHVMYVYVTCSINLIFQFFISSL